MQKLAESDTFRILRSAEAEERAGGDTLKLGWRREGRVEVDRAGLLERSDPFIGLGREIDHSWVKKTRSDG